MSRAASGTVEWRGNPARWWARLTVRTEAGETKRVWVDLERTNLANTLEDKKVAKRIAAKRARLASKKTFVGAEKATAPKVTLEDLEEKWFKLIENDPDLKLATVSRLKSSWTGIVATLGRRQVADLTPPVLRQWILDLRTDKSVSTVRNDVNALTRVFKDALAQRWVAPASNPAIGEMIDYLLGQQPPSTRGRHYQAPPMAELARTVGLLHLSLPSRSGVSQSSPSSKASGGGTSETSGGEGIRTPGQLAPSAVFKTAAIDHSATPPSARLPSFGSGSYLPTP